MRILKIITFILLFFTIQKAIWANLEIKTNIPWWEYKNVIEIYLVSNKKDTKIFYYLDNEWRFDNIKEFNWNPIIVKKDTTINFFSAIDEIKSTQIKQEFFNLNYPNNVEIGYKEGKIFLKNNTNEIINIWYWKIYADNLNLIIPKNYYLNPSENFEIFYQIKENENISLYSPDDKITKKYTHKPKAVTSEKKNTPPRKDIKKPEIQPQINTEISSDLVQKEVKLISFDDILWNTKWSALEYKNLSNTPENKKNNQNVLIFWFIISLSIIILHNFFLNIRQKKLANLKKKRNKNFTF